VPPYHPWPGDQQAFKRWMKCYDYIC
jgi:hypothetical protein